jgi:hypothetical protein
LILGESPRMGPAVAISPLETQRLWRAMYWNCFPISG